MPNPIAGSLALAPKRRALALWIVLTAQLMLALDFLIVVVALPRIQQDLGFSAAGLTWVLNAFGLAFGGLLLLGGRLGDLIGQVRAFQLGLGLFVLASLVGGLAQIPPVLIAARVAQGVGAALAAPSVLALIMVMARDDAERAKGLSLFTAVSSIGASAGLILGGVLTDCLTWRWALLINVPIGVVVVTVIGRLVAESRPRPARIDMAGALTATLGSAALVLGFISAAETGWAAGRTLWAFAAAAVLLTGFYRIERRHPSPLLELSLLHDRSRRGGLLVMALVNGAHFAVLFLIVQYLQRALGWSPLAAGLGYLPLTATVYVISQFAPRLIATFGARALLVAGSLTVAASLLGFARLTDDSAYVPAVLIPLLVHAVGVALIFAPGTVAIMDGAPARHAGALSGLLQMDQQIGGALGIAAFTALSAVTAVPERFSAGLPAAFIGGAALPLAAAVIAWRMVRPAAAPAAPKALAPRA